MNLGKNTSSKRMPKRIQSRRLVRHQKGISLIVALIMMIAISLLGVSAAQIAMQSEKSSRGDRDRQIAMQAAESALKDAEMDIRGSPDPESRSDKFSTYPLEEDFIEGCGAGLANRSLGLCKPSSDLANPVWIKVDFSDSGDNSTRSVPFGRFTGQKMQIGTSMLPSQLPRYIIENVPFQAPPMNADQVATVYRITAIGFGVKPTTQVVLQSFYFKDDKLK